MSISHFAHKSEGADFRRSNLSNPNLIAALFSNLKRLIQAADCLI